MQPGSQNETQQLLANWISKFSKNPKDKKASTARESKDKDTNAAYVAYTVKNEDVADTLNTECVKSPEQRLQENGVKDILKALKEEKMTIADRVTFTNTIPFLEASSLGIVDDRTFEAECAKHSYGGLGKQVLENIPWVLPSDTDQRFPALVEIRELARRFNCYEDSVSAALEVCNQQSANQRFAKVWEAHQEFDYDHRKLFNHLIRMSRLQFQNNFERLEFSATYNGINWRDGEVVALRGNPNLILSTFNKSKRDSDMRVPVDEVALRDGQKVDLLFPFENHGKIFSLDLTQEDTIIIAPKEVISKLKNATNAHRIKMFSIEDMSDEQLDFFKVPDRLRPAKIHRVVEHPASVLGSPSEMRGFSDNPHSEPVARSDANTQGTPPSVEQTIDAAQQDQAAILEEYYNDHKIGQTMVTEFKTHVQNAQLEESFEKARTVQAVQPQTLSPKTAQPFQLPPQRDLTIIEDSLESERNDDEEEQIDSVNEQDQAEDLFAQQPVFNSPLLDPTAYGPLRRVGRIVDHIAQGFGEAKSLLDRQGPARTPAKPTVNLNTSTVRANLSSRDSHTVAPVSIQQRNLSHQVDEVTLPRGIQQRQILRCTR